MNLKKQLIIFLIIANILFIIANIPLIRLYIHTPAATYFPLVHHEQVDYYLYLSTIRQSMEGNWSTAAVYTSEPTANSYLYIFLVSVGKAANLFHLTPPVAYHVARILSMQMLFISLFLVCRMVFHNWWATVGGISALLVSVPPVFLLRMFDITAPLWWEDNLDALSRLNLLPHHAAGTALLLFTVLAVFAWLQTPEKKYYIISLFTALLTALVFPPAGLVILFGLPAAAVILHLKRKFLNKSVSVKFIACISLISICTFFGLLFLKHETDKGFPWSQWSVWDRQMWNQNVSGFNRDFLIGTGFLFSSSIVIIGYSFFSRSLEYDLIFVSVWVVLPYILLPFTDLLNIGRIRVVYMAQFVPAAICMTLLARQILSKMQTQKKRIICIVTAIVLFFAFNITSSYSYFVSKLFRNASEYPGINTYVPLNILDSMYFFRRLEPKNSVVLADFAVANMLPAFTPVTSYSGHWTQTKDYNRKTGEMVRFYSGNMSWEEARNFLNEGKIQYIYFGNSEKSFKGDITSYHLNMKEVYNSGGIQIYKLDQFL